MVGRDGNIEITRMAVLQLCFQGKWNSDCGYETERNMQARRW